MLVPDVLASFPGASVPPARTRRLRRRLRRRARRPVSTPAGSAPVRSPSPLPSPPYSSIARMHH